MKTIFRHLFIKRRSLLHCIITSCLIYGLAIPSMLAAYPQVEILLVGATSGAETAQKIDPQPNSLFFRGEDRYFLDAHDDDSVSASSAFRNVYPGVSLAHFVDDHHIEFAFAIKQGADPSLIRFILEGVKRDSVTSGGHVIYRGEGLEVYQHAPVIRRIETDGATRVFSAQYTTLSETETLISSPSLHQTDLDEFNDTLFNVVPGDVGVDGPDYDFYMSRFETTNRQWVRFLNSAQQNPNNALGENLFFDKDGNVWFHPDMVVGRDEIFQIDPNVIRYTPDRLRGDRYRLISDERGSNLHADLPVTGVSWFGALKYCNWLTVHTGRGLDQRAYHEGTNQLDWAPITATNWHEGVFSASERQAWTEMQGFRLPMFLMTDPSSDRRNQTFNEFFKAAAWNGQTNTLYGFGRSTFATNDAVVLDVLMRHDIEQLMPVGFFDGINRLPAGRTLRNENGFGIHDLTGNVSEWLNDFGSHGEPGMRFVAGGSFQDPIRPVAEAKKISPSTSSAAGGFRPVTTYMPEATTFINVLFCFHTTNDVPHALREKYRIPAPGIPLDPIAESPGFIPDPERILPEVGIESPPDIDRIPDDLIDESDLPDMPGALIPGVDPTDPVAPIVTPPSVTPPSLPPSDIDPTAPLAPPGPPPPPPPPITFTLLVESRNPNSGVDIDVTPADVDSLTSGSTGFTRTYTAGENVALTAPVDVGGRPFVEWLYDGSFHSTSNVAAITMTTNVTMTAVYAVRLTVRAQGPDGAMSTPIDVSPDITGAAAGTTVFDRYYAPGAGTTLIAPRTSNGNVFSHWSIGGVSQGSDPTITLPMLTDTDITAVYISPPSSPSGL